MADLLGGLGGLDLGGGPSLTPAAAPTPAAPQLSFDDPFCAPASGSAGAPAAVAPLPVLLPADKGKGLTISGRVVRRNGGVGEYTLHGNIVKTFFWWGILRGGIWGCRCVKHMLKAVQEGG